MSISSLQIMTKPQTAWHTIEEKHLSVARVLLTHTLPLALVPAICWYVGMAITGWEIGSTGRQKMTPESALMISILFYAAMVFGVLFLGWIIDWMSQTYEADSSLARAVTIVSFTATPFFVSGVLGLYPSLWLDMFVGVAAGSYCVYLLYVGVPIMLHIEPERGFLFASAVVAVALVALVALMGTTIILWDFGAEPVYTY